MRNRECSYNILSYPLTFFNCHNMSDPSIGPGVLAISLWGPEIRSQIATRACLSSNAEHWSKTPGTHVTFDFDLASDWPSLSVTGTWFLHWRLYSLDPPVIQSNVQVQPLKSTTGCYVCRHQQRLKR